MDHFEPFDGDDWQYTDDIGDEPEEVEYGGGEELEDVAPTDRHPYVLEYQMNDFDWQFVPGEALDIEVVSSTRDTKHVSSAVANTQFCFDYKSTLNIGVVGTWPKRMAWMVI